MKKRHVHSLLRRERVLQGQACQGLLNGAIATVCCIAITVVSLWYYPNGPFFADLLMVSLDLLVLFLTMFCVVCLVCSKRRVRELKMNVLKLETPDA